MSQRYLSSGRAANRKDVIYSCSITATKGGSEAGATSTILSVTSGLVWLLEVDFPPGCCGLAHFRMFDGKYQLFPATPGASFAGDSVTLHLDDLYMKQASPYEFRVETWNEDEKWDHTLGVRVGMAMTRAEMSRYMPALSFENFERLLAEMIANQELARQAQLEASLRELSGG